MTDISASPAFDVMRARVGFFLLASTAFGITAMYAPEIGAAVSGLLDPCVAPRIQKADISALLPPPTAPDTVKPFFLKAVNPAEQERAVRCLTDALYYEAANEPEPGQRAIAQVVVNRVRDKHFPKSVCGVVYEGWERHTGCQFSFVCDGSIRRRPADPAVWTRLRPLAEQALDGHVEPEVGTATHYYATYVRPGWRRSVAQIADIGNHVFCSWKGKAGQPSALTSTYEGGEFQVADAALDGARKTVKTQGAPARRAHAGRSLRSSRSAQQMARLVRREGRRRERYA